MSETLFIADLHLSESRPDLIRVFLHFLKHRARSAEALYILGDFFDFWIGDDCIQPWQTNIARALKEYSKTHKLYFMRGNRDFLVGPRFCQKAGCTLLPDYYKLQLKNTSILLLHGDTLCTKDSYYRWYRRVVHHSLTQKIFTLLPKKIRANIAARIRNISQRSNASLHSSQKDTSIKDAQPDAVIQVMQQHHVSCLIHGHTHRPAQHTHTLNDGNNPHISGTRWVLGDWGSHWWVLSYHDGMFAQESYPLKSKLS